VPSEETPELMRCFPHKLMKLVLLAMRRALETLDRLIEARPSLEDWCVLASA
jgi:hypothetical protein